MVIKQSRSTVSVEFESSVNSYGDRRLDNCETAYGRVCGSGQKRNLELRNNEIGGGEADQAHLQG